MVDNQLRARVERELGLLFDEVLKGNEQYGLYERRDKLFRSLEGVVFFRKTIQHTTPIDIDVVERGDKLFLVARYFDKVGTFIPTPKDIEATPTNIRSLKSHLAYALTC